MIAITGAAGFIGSNLVHAVNARGSDDVVAVDESLDPERFGHLRGADVADVMSPDAFLSALVAGDPRTSSVEIVLHQGAITSTTEADGDLVLRRNFEYSRALIEACAHRSIPVVYASSAAVYGDLGAVPRPSPLRPLNLYALSKSLVDRYVERAWQEAPAMVAGLRYFNVYGPRESHKGSMASIVRQLDDQLATTGCATLFGPSHGLAAGEQSRDFVHVDDVVDVVCWFVEHRNARGVYDVGTGTATSFNEIASLVLEHHTTGRVEYVPFPAPLREAYQAATRADLGRLRSTGYDGVPRGVRVGVPAYLRWRREVGDLPQVDGPLGR